MSELKDLNFTPEILAQLENGLVPVYDDTQMHIVNWTEDLEVAEELLMQYHGYGKKDYLNMPLEEFKIEVQTALAEKTDGRAKVIGLMFAELINYKRQLCLPIVEGDSAFFTKLEEVDLITFGILNEVLAELKEIRLVNGTSNNK